MSTPCGPHQPISPASFGRRVNEWHDRTLGVRFDLAEYAATMAKTNAGDLIYCDPPYSHSQSILYGAQSFSFGDLLTIIRRCKERGVFVALSIDGSKRSGQQVCDLPIPADLFEREVLIDCGRSMLKRFQMNGQSLEGEIVADRLLLTY
jgi:DNA adenine methylase